MKFIEKIQIIIESQYSLFDYNIMTPHPRSLSQISDQRRCTKKDPKKSLKKVTPMTFQKVTSFEKMLSKRGLNSIRKMILKMSKIRNSS
jgi:hypothetical protein